VQTVIVYAALVIGFSAEPGVKHSCNIDFQYRFFTGNMSRAPVLVTAQRSIRLFTKPGFHHPPFQEFA
jgi:hypothetical protein